MTVVGHLAVKEALRRELTACVDIGGQGGHLSVIQRSIFWIHDVHGVRGRGGLESGAGGLESGVGTRGCLGGGCQVGELPVVLKLVTDFKSRCSCLEGALAVRSAAGADGNQFAAVEITVRTETIGRFGPGASVVHGVVEGWRTGRGGVDAVHIAEGDEEGALTFNVRVYIGVGRETGGWCVRVGTPGVSNTDVGVLRTRVGGAGAVVCAAVVVLADAHRGEVGLSFLDVTKAVGGDGAGGAVAAERDGLPTGSCGTHRGGCWGIADG